MNNEPHQNVDQNPDQDVEILNHTYVQAKQNFPIISEISQFYLQAIQDIFLELNLNQFSHAVLYQATETILDEANLNATEIILDRLIFSVNQLVQKASTYEYHHLTNGADNLEAILVEIKQNLVNFVSLPNLHQLLMNHILLLRDIVHGYVNGQDVSYFLHLEKQWKNISQTFKVMQLNRQKLSHQFNDEYIFAVNSVSSEPDVILENNLDQPQQLTPMSPFECDNQEELLALFDSHNFLESATEEADFIFALGQIDQTTDAELVSDDFAIEVAKRLECQDDSSLSEDALSEDDVVDDDPIKSILGNAISELIDEAEPLDSAVDPDDLEQFDQDLFEDIANEQLYQTLDENIEDTSFESFLMGLNQFDHEEVISNFDADDSHDLNINPAEDSAEIINGIEFDASQFDDELTILESVNLEDNSLANISICSENTLTDLDSISNDDSDSNQDIYSIPSENIDHSSNGTSDYLVNHEDETQLDLVIKDLAFFDGDKIEPHGEIKETNDLYWDDDLQIPKIDGSSNQLNADSWEDFLGINSEDHNSLIDEPQVISFTANDDESMTQLQLAEEQLPEDEFTFSDANINPQSNDSTYTYESFMEMLTASEPDANLSHVQHSITNSSDSHHKESNQDDDLSVWQWAMNDPIDTDQDNLITDNSTQDNLISIDELTEFDQFEGVPSISHIYDFSANEQLLETINVADSQIFEDNDELLSNYHRSDNSLGNNMVGQDDDDYVQTLERLINFESAADLDISNNLDYEFDGADNAFIQDQNHAQNVDNPSYQIDNLADFFDGEFTAEINNLLDDSGADIHELLDLQPITPELVSQHSFDVMQNSTAYSNEHEMFWQNLQDIVTGNSEINHDDNWSDSQTLKSGHGAENVANSAYDLSIEFASSFNDDNEPSSGLEVDPNLAQQIFANQKIEQITQHKKSIRFAHEELQYLKQLSETTLSRQVLLDQQIRDINTLTGDLVQELPPKYRNHRLQELLSHLHQNLKQMEDNSHSVETSLSQIYQRINQSQICPFRQVSKRLRQLVQQWSMIHNQQTDKNVELCITGEDTWIDRQLTEVLYDLLQHLLRNAYEHGIESAPLRRRLGKHPTGIITIQAEANLQNTIISIHDDGAGLDLEKIQSGLTHHQTHEPNQPMTTESLLDQALIHQDDLTQSELLDNILDLGFNGIKGVGVGLDIVRTTIQELGGTMGLQTAANQGTRITLTIPSVPPLVKAIILEQSGMLIAVPDNLVEKVIAFDHQCLQSGGQLNTSQEVYLWQDQLLPVIRLDRDLHINCRCRDTYLQYRPVGVSQSVIIVNVGEQQCALIAAACWGLQQAIMHQVNGDISLPSQFVGCLATANGQVVPILNPDFLAKNL